MLLKFRVVVVDNKLIGVFISKIFRQWLCYLVVTCKKIPESLIPLLALAKNEYL